MTKALQSRLSLAVPKLEPHQAGSIVAVCEQAQSLTDIPQETRTILNQYLPQEMQFAEPLRCV